ncbi:MAG: permease [Actinomycetota bacterium]
MRKKADAAASPETSNASPRRKPRWDLLFLVLSVAAFTGLGLFFRDKGGRALRISWEYFREMVFILPAVMVLMGLFAVWVKRETVVKYLGQESGLSGLLLSVLLGTLPTGPLYVAFPLAAMLLRKGARVANVIVFLCAWACIKLPQELMEFQFLGWRFTLLRLALTVALVIPMGLVAEALYHRGPGEGEDAGRKCRAPDRVHFSSS